MSEDPDRDNWTTSNERLKGDHWLRWYTLKYEQRIKEIKEQNRKTQKLKVEREKELELNKIKEEREVENRAKRVEDMNRWLEEKKKLKKEEILRSKEAAALKEEEERRRKIDSQEAYDRWLKANPNRETTSEAFAFYHFKKITYLDTTTRVEPSMVNYNHWDNCDG